MQSFVEYGPEHPYSIHNLPYGSFYTDAEPSRRRCGVAIGDLVLDLNALSNTLFWSPALPKSIFDSVSSLMCVCRGNCLLTCAMSGQSECVHVARQITVDCIPNPSANHPECRL